MNESDQQQQQYQPAQQYGQYEPPHQQQPVAQQQDRREDHADARQSGEAGSEQEQPADIGSSDIGASGASTDTSSAAAAAAESVTPNVAVTPEAIVAPRDRTIATREYYAISEVCDLVGLKPHVLRYWETQFPVLNPSKNRSGNRVYQRKEIKLILLVKHLLYKEKYTIDGAKQRLEQLRRGGELPTETARALDSQMVELLRAELQQALQFLTVDPAEPRY